MKLNSHFSRIVDCIHGLFWSPQQHELKFQRCQGFKSERIKAWKTKSGLSWRSADKILNQIEVFDGIKIRELILNKVQERDDIFKDENLFITSFGESAKSGEVIFYDFRHTSNFEKRFKIIDSSKIEDIPSKSRIVFVDDLIGTGKQSVEYIQDRLFKLLKPSHRPCLFSICGTQEGINHVKNNSGFDVVCARELQKETFDHFDPSNNTFSDLEKRDLKAINSLLGRNEYTLGLLVAFYYGTPNNTMPFIWKEGCKYVKPDGSKDSWAALIPRKY